MELIHIIFNGLGTAYINYLTLIFDALISVVFIILAISIMKHSN